MLRVIITRHFHSFIVPSLHSTLLLPYEQPIAHQSNETSRFRGRSVESMEIDTAASPRLISITGAEARGVVPTGDVTAGQLQVFRISRGRSLINWVKKTLGRIDRSIQAWWTRHLVTTQIKLLSGPDRVPPAYIFPVIAPILQWEKRGATSLDAEDTVWNGTFVAIGREFRGIETLTRRRNLYCVDEMVISRGRMGSCCMLRRYYEGKFGDLRFTFG